MFVMALLGDAHKRKEDLNITHNSVRGVTPVSILMSVFLDFMQSLYVSVTCMTPVYI